MFYVNCGLFMCLLFIFVCGVLFCLFFWGGEVMFMCHEDVQKNDFCSLFCFCLFVKTTGFCLKCVWKKYPHTE